jgi:hypothetical protein
VGTNLPTGQPPQEPAGAESGCRIHQYIPEDVRARIGRAAAKVEDFWSQLLDEPEDNRAV